MNFTKISRELINSLEFRQFTQTDYHGFSGVESPIPLIAELDSEGILMIIDGDAAELYAYDGCGNIEMIDECFNIRELPYKSARQIEIEESIKRMESELATMREVLATFDN